MFVVAEKFLENSIWEYDIALNTGKTVFVFVKKNYFMGIFKRGLEIGQSHYGMMKMSWHIVLLMKFPDMDTGILLGGISLNILWVRFLKVMDA